MKSYDFVIIAAVSRYFFSIANDFRKFDRIACAKMAAMWYILLGIGVCFSVVNCGTDVKQCPGSNSLTEAILGDCNKPPCPLKRGTKMRFKITFTPENYSAKVKTNVYGTKFGLKYPWPGLDEVDACSGMTPPCPLRKGKSYTWAGEGEIKNNIPKVTLPSHVALKDDSGKDLTCFDVQIKIT